MTTPSESGGEERFEPMPSAPALSESEARPGVPAPRAVQVSFILWLVAAAATIVSAVLVLATSVDTFHDSIRDSLRDAGQPFGEEDIRKVVTAFKATIGIVSGLFVVAYVLFGVALRSGKNWGRIGATIAGGLTLLLLIYTAISGGAGVLSILVILVLVVAVYLLYRPESKQFFASAKAAR